MPIEALGPVEMEESNACAGTPEPPQRERRRRDGIEAVRGQMAVQQAEVGIPRRR